MIRMRIKRTQFCKYESMEERVTPGENDEEYGQ